MANVRADCNGEVEEIRVTAVKKAQNLAGRGCLSYSFLRSTSGIVQNTQSRDQTCTTAQSLSLSSGDSAATVLLNFSTSLASLCCTSIPVVAIPRRISCGDHAIMKRTGQGSPQALRIDFKWIRSPTVLSATACPMPPCLTHTLAPHTPSLGACACAHQIRSVHDDLRRAAEARVCEQEDVVRHVRHPAEVLRRNEERACLLNNRLQELHELRAGLRKLHEGFDELGRREDEAREAALVEEHRQELAERGDERGGAHAVGPDEVLERAAHLLPDVLFVARAQGALDEPPGVRRNDGGGARVLARQRASQHRRQPLKLIVHQLGPRRRRRGLPLIELRQLREDSLLQEIGRVGVGTTARVGNSR